VELLEHCREAFGEEEKLTSKVLLQFLIERDESPWADMRGKPLNERVLAKMLRPYGIKSRTIRDRHDGGKTPKGYHKADFVDAWNRYLPASDERHKRHKRHDVDNENNNVADVADVAASNGPKGIPHPVYGHDGFSSLRQPLPALGPKDKIA
jgi:hypothetical protein